LPASGESRAGCPTGVQPQYFRLADLDGIPSDDLRVHLKARELLMRRHLLPALLLAGAFASPAAAQQNPFQLLGGSLKSAYVVYQVKREGKPVPGGQVEIGVTPRLWAMRLVVPYNISGRSDTIRTQVLETGDSMYQVTSVAGTRDGEVSVSLRPHLVKEFASLDAAGQRRVLENLKQIYRAGGDDKLDRLVTAVGSKQGTESIAGHTCDVYGLKKQSACVLPQAPAVPLRSTSEESGGQDLVASRVVLNGTIPTALTTLPKGVRWKHSDNNAIGGFAFEIWGKEKQSDPSTVAPAELARFSLNWLARPETAAALRENGAEDASQ
jgi:hypothetical protein